jgi:type II restriction/modification system DNA methylase subunit YeeA
VNTNKLKPYAQTARREFIDAVTERAHHFGLKENSIVPCEVKGDFAIINGNAFPSRVDEQRRALEEQVNRKGFSQVMEEVAYTWFNRFAAIRYMELHGFLSHGYRVLSHPEGNSIPEILEKAQHVELTGLYKEEVIKLKMDGTKDEELYSKLLIAECNELSKAMPFLFEYVQDYTELLLPDNLLHSDSIIRKLVNEIDEEDWQEVEIIGWLYQFYISEKKDEVIGKVVKSEDIPAATQLFTPNWIVKYLVQNSLGAQWMRTYPDSALKTRMEYYIEPAEQTDEVNAKIKNITPDTLNPEELTLLDPACGSGHILVEAYDLLKEIYLERGYRKRDIPVLILAKNLYGLEIDDRAAQLAGFAVMMKARADDRSIFDRNMQPNIVSIQESKGIKTGNGFEDLVNLFEHAKTYGSLIRVPDELADKLPEVREKIEKGKKGLDKQDLWTGSQYYEMLLSLVNQAEMLSHKYDAVVTNPPYMGGKGMNALLKEFSNTQYPITKSDLFAIFIERGFEMVKQTTGNIAMITMPAWLFLSSYEKLRYKIVSSHCIDSLLHIGRGIFGIDWGSTAFVIRNTKIINNKGSYFRLHKRLFQHIYYEDIKKLFLFTKNNKDYKYDFESYRDSKGVSEILKEGCKDGDRIYYTAKTDDFEKIPGSPISYWVSDSVREIFVDNPPLDSKASVKAGLQTGNTEKFLRLWFEVPHDKIGFKMKNREVASSSAKKWFPLNKGGEFRKWYGNNEYLVNWHKDGLDIHTYHNLPMDYNGAPVRAKKFYFQEGITWALISSGTFGCRYFEEGMIFDISSHSLFCNQQHLLYYLAFLCSKLGNYFIKILNPTLNTSAGVVSTLPIVENSELFDQVTKISSQLIQISKIDWNFFEISWDFNILPMLALDLKGASVSESYSNWNSVCADNIIKMKELEEENNRFFIKSYGLQNELSPDVPEGQITLACADKEADIKRLISYSVGCMMGRYSLDIRGLVYAHAGNDRFDHNKYKTFPADGDGIVPITEHEWFDDDAACSFFGFIETAWDKDTLEDNLEFVADAIGRKTNESSRDAIRRYFVNEFYKDHLKTYKKRPIYWMFTSGKEKAFQALVYLHRYNEGTLSRMRTEYVLPLQGKITTRMEHLEKDKDHASSTSAANKIQKEIGRLRKQKEELLKFDENLHHYADKKISLDLDDGVKVNYGKFGDLLAEVKAITGKKKK